MAQFSQDWFSQNSKYWERHIVPKFAGKPRLKFLEIGCFEGKATVWMLDNILTDQTSQITTIDTFEGSTEHQGGDIDVAQIEKAFMSNIEPYREKVSVHKGYSQIILRTFSPEETYDLIYVDGSHHPVDVLEDAVLSFRLLKKGGVLVFDDYTWMVPGEPNDRPGIAIESFMSTHRDTMELIHIGWQVFLVKK